MKTLAILTTFIIFGSAAFTLGAQKHEEKLAGIISEAITLAKEIQKISQQQSQDVKLKQINTERNQRYQIINCMDNLRNTRNQGQSFTQKLNREKKRTAARVAQLAEELKQQQRKLKFLNSVQNEDDCTRIRNQEQIQVQKLEVKASELRRPYELQMAKAKDKIANYNTKCIEFSDLFKIYALKPQYVDSVLVYAYFQNCNANMNWMANGKNYANANINLYRNRSHGYYSSRITPGTRNTIKHNNKSYTVISSNNRYICLLAGDLQISFNLNQDADKPVSKTIFEFVDVEKLAKIKIPGQGD